MTASVEGRLSGVVIEKSFKSNEFDGACFKVGAVSKWQRVRPYVTWGSDLQMIKLQRP
jgi:hypothetical protein